MARIIYVPKKFTSAHQGIIDSANAICEEYDAQGLSLTTLRQLYYQFVARGYIANKQTEYNRLGSIINDKGATIKHWVPDAFQHGSEAAARAKLDADNAVGANQKKEIG